MAAHLRIFAARHSRLLGLAAVAVVAGIVPLLVNNSYYLNVWVLIGIYSIIAVGLSLLMGYAGQVSLGHAAFYGLGAYTSAIGTTRFDLNPWLCILIGIAVTAFLAWLIGRPTLRLHGHYLAMATLAIGIIIQIVFREGGTLTGGFSGIPGIPRLSIGGFAFKGVVRYCYLVWPILIATMAISFNLVNSRTGRALRAIHDSEVAARACGVDVAGQKLTIFVISAIFASLAGSLYAHFITFISPDPFGSSFSVMLVVMVIIGGQRSLWGALAGTAIITVLGQALLKLSENVPALAGLDIVFFGVILIVAVIYMPAGFAGWIMSRFARSNRAASDAPANERTESGDAA